jgi:transcriptional regulator with XRE-family HTH domain
MTNEDLGFAIWLIRESRGLLQREAARSAGCTRPQWSEWEIGTKLPTVEAFLRICRGLGVSPGACLQIAEARSCRLVLLKKPVQRAEVEWRRAA